MAVLPATASLSVQWVWARLSADGGTPRPPSPGVCPTNFTHTKHFIAIISSHIRNQKISILLFVVSHVANSHQQFLIVGFKAIIPTEGASSSAGHDARHTAASTLDMAGSRFPERSPWLPIRQTTSLCSTAGPRCHRPFCCEGIPQRDTL